MANRERGGLTKVIGGQTYQLVLDFNALCELEDLYDKPYDQVFAEGSMGVRELRAVLWVALLKDNPDATLRSAGDLASDLGSDLEATIKALLDRSGLVSAKAPPARPRKPARRAK